MEACGEVAHPCKTRQRERSSLARYRGFNSQSALKAYFLSGNGFRKQGAVRCQSEIAGVMAQTPALSTKGPVYVPLHRPSRHHAGSMSRTAFTLAVTYLKSKGLRG